MIFSNTKESGFETLIVDWLVQHNGYEEGSNEDYDKVIEPMYMALNMSKAEFVKCLDKKRFAKKPEIKETPVFISDGTRTPNGCYYIGKWMMQIGEPKTNIRNRKITYSLRNRSGIQHGNSIALSNHACIYP